MRTAVIILLCVTAGGCSWLKLPRLPQRVLKPAAVVTQVRQVERSEIAARYEIDVSLYNPNDFPLPITFAAYSLSIGGSSYKTDTVPSATLPATGRLTVSLPAVLRTGAEAGSDAPGFDASGTFTITPEGEMRRMLYEIGFPKPRAVFNGRGEVGATIGGGSAQPGK